MRGYLKKLQADSFEDIVAMLALYRPGPLDAGMVDDHQANNLPLPVQTSLPVLDIKIRH
jgi:DNA polymerase III alpha subunit